MMHISETNRVEYKYYEKPMSSNVYIQRLTAVDENSKMKTLSNDLTRRLLNTSESLDDEVRVEVINKYSQKLINSGYGVEQVRRIIINGIKGYHQSFIRTYCYSSQIL